MEGSPRWSTVMYAPASVVELALPLKLAAGHVGRARRNKHFKMLWDSLWPQLCKQASILLGWWFGAVYIAVLITNMHSLCWIRMSFGSIGVTSEGCRVMLQMPWWIAATVVNISYLWCVRIKVMHEKPRVPEARTWSAGRWSWFFQHFSLLRARYVASMKKYKGALG